MAVSAVDTGLLARHRFPLEPRSTPTHTGDALCPFSKIQKQAAFGITPLRSGFQFARFSFPLSAISASPREASLLLLCMLTLCCASLRLPTLGYTFDLPLGYALSRGCSLPVDFATLHPSGCLRQSFSLRSIMSPYGLPSAGSVGSHSSQNVSPYGLLMQPTAQPPCCLVPSQRPLACVQVSSFKFQIFLPPLKTLLALSQRD